MDEPKPVYNALQVYRERGAFLRRLEQLDNAKVAYDEAYNVCPDDVRLLMGRSQVCSDAVRPAQAFADAELALKYEPQNTLARNVQARALYTLSEFERSVVMNYRGARIRKQPPYFLEGISQGLETLQDCVGANSSGVLLKYLPIIKQNENVYADENEPCIKQRVSRIPRQVTQKKLTQLEAHRQESLAKVLAKKYLGPMACDKFFLKKLSEDSCVKSANAKGSRKLKEVVDEALKTITERHEMLREQRPYYSVKLAEKSYSKYQARFKEELLQKERKAGERTAELYLNAIETSLSQLRIKDVIDKAERMQLFLDTKTPRTLPDKDMYLDRLYRLVGEGYLVQHRISYRHSDRANKCRIAFLMGLPVGRPSSYDSVRANYAYKCIDDVNLAIAKLLDTINMCENATMRCCLLYDLARLHSIQKNFIVSKYYAKRCQREAQESENVAWWLNACLVLISADMQQGNPNEVLAAADEALEFSKKMKNPENVQSFLAKCKQMASESVDDVRTTSRRREKEILKVIDDTTRAEAKILFKRMSTVPGSRHFNVMSTEPETGKSERRTYGQRGLTIIPGKEKGLTRPPKSEARGFQVFDY